MHRIFQRCGLPSSVLRKSAQQTNFLRAKRGKALSRGHIRIIETVHISDTRIIEIALLAKNIFSSSTQNQSNPRRLVETSCCTFYLPLRGGGVTLHCQACPPFLSTASNPTSPSIASRGILCLSPLVQKLLNQTRQSSFEPMAVVIQPTLSLDAKLIHRKQRRTAVVSEFETSFKAGVIRDHA